MNTISDLRRILGSCRAIAVVGLSPQWHRPSFFAAKYMQGAATGYRIVPVNPSAPEIPGQRSYPSGRPPRPRRSRRTARRSTWVDCFRKNADIPPIVDEAIAIGAKCL